MCNSRGIFAGLMLLACLGALGGCVERKLTIGSDPEGALVSLNDVEVGRTPVSVPFSWYGDYDVRIHLEKNLGTPEKPEIHQYYLHTNKQTKLPWFEVIGMDLFAELLPIPFKDEQVWAFPVPEVAHPTDPESVKRADAELVERAQKLKAEMDKPEELQAPKK